MSFQPVVPLSGYGGWKFLSRTLAKQTGSFNKSPLLQREITYFKQKIGSVTSAGALVSDRTLLKVALGAFGLSADLPNRYFIQKVLTEGTTNSGSLANRLADKRYLDLSKTFGFGDPSGPRTKLKSLAASIIARYEQRQFEAALGTQNQNMRLALAAKRALAVIAGNSATDTTRWLTIMGNIPLRKVFETAFGLPQGFAALDLDRQLSSLKSHASREFGSSTVAQFSDPARIEDLLRRFFARAQPASATPSPLVPGASALLLLNGGATGSSIILSLLR